MRGFHRHAGKFDRRCGGPLRGAIWMIGIGIMMLWGHWWPGILVLIGISMVLGAIWTSGASQEMGDTSRPPMTPMAPIPPRAPITPVEFNRVPPAPASAGPHIDLLPATCPRCGAPVRSPDVKWRGDHFAACAYCGSNVITKTTRL